MHKSVNKACQRKFQFLIFQADNFKRILYFGIPACKFCKKSYETISHDSIIKKYNNKDTEK